MARRIGEIIAASCNMSLRYAERLLKDIPAEDFARFARPGGTVVVSNHPAFVFGHLSLYGARIVEHLGGDTTGLAAPPEFQQQFSKDASCQDDAAGTLYPSRDQITEVYYRGYRAALEQLRAADDDRFEAPNPATGPIRDLFPSLGAMHAFLVGGHMMMHLGQVSAWRRMMGLPPA